MATVREIRARFVGDVAALRTALRSVQTEASSLGPAVQRSTNTANRAYATLGTNATRLRQQLQAAGAGDTFDDLNRATERARIEMQETGRVSAATMQDLERAVNSASGELQNMGSEARAGLSGVEGALGAVQTDLQQLAGAADNAGDQLNNLGGGNNNLNNLAGDADQAADNLNDLGDQANQAGDQIDNAADEIQDFGDTAERETENAGGAFSKLGGTLGKMAGLFAGIFAVDAMKDFGINVVETTADIQALQGQYEQVMGGMKDDTDKYLGEMAETWNKHPNELKTAYMGYVALLKGKGVAEEDAHKIARNTLEATVDANAFANESMADTTARFMGGLKGEYDSLDTAMVNMNATMLDTLAQEEYGKAFADLTVTQQEMLKQQEMVRQHTAAGVVGQGAREADTYNNNLAMLKETWKEFIASYGGPLMEFANNRLKDAVGFVRGLGDRITEAKAKLEPLTTAFGALKEFLSGNETAEDVLMSYGLDPRNFQAFVDSANSIFHYLSRIRTEGVPLFKEFAGAAKAGLIDLWPSVKAAVMGAVTFIGQYIQFLMDMWDQHGSKIARKVKEVLIDIWPSVRAAVSAVVSFIGSMVKKIVDFWQSDGRQIAEAATNIFNGILKVIQFVMPFVLAIIKSVWGNIKGVITGALDVIMGVVKIFSGLFTGDFSKMWEGVKQLFKGAVNFLWNFVQLTFYGKILGGAKAFFLAFRGGFATLWTGIKGLFTGGVGAAWQTIKTGWKSMLDETVKVFRNIFNFLRDTWNSIRSISKGFIDGVKFIFTQGWTTIRTATTNSFNGIWNFLKGIWQTIRNFVSTSVSGISRTIRDTWSAVRSNTSGAFRDVFNSVKSRFTDIVNAAKALPGRIGDGIGSMASKVTSGVTRVINTLARVLGKGINGVIGGVNWVLGKIGVDKDIPKWSVPQYAQGTKGAHPGGLMIVGDGTGSNAGPELIETPDGKQMLSPSKPTLTAAPKGTKVWSAKETREIMDMIPHYALGDLKGKARAAGEWVADKWNKGKQAVSNVGSKIKDVAVNAFDYIKKPGKFLDLALKTLGIQKPKGGDFTGDMAVGAWNKVKESAIAFVKKKLEGFGLTQSGITVTGGNGGGFGAPFRLTSKPGPRNTGIPGASRYHKGWDWAAPTGTPIPSVSDGVVVRDSWHPLSGNFIEVRSGNRVHRYQHNSKNIARLGQKVKKGQTIALVGMTGVGSGPHLHYELKGYENGGIVSGDLGPQLAWLTEGGFAESVISHDPAKRGSQEEIWQRTGQMLGFNNGQDNGAILAMLTRIARAVESGQNIIMDEQVVAEILKDPLTKLQQLDNEITDIYSR